ncbi:MAG: hypothetical protein IJZ55_08420 [Lachnospiraceae bacterium]|nr:hypothetical protein [Lachnospiraceae bacterium]
MTNQEIRAMMKNEKIFLWQVAEILGIHETTLIKHFRTEMSEHQKKQVLQAIHYIKQTKCCNQSKDEV